MRWLDHPQVLRTRQSTPSPAMPIRRQPEREPKEPAYLPHLDAHTQLVVPIARRRSHLEAVATEPLEPCREGLRLVGLQDACHTVVVGHRQVESSVLYADPLIHAETCRICRRGDPILSDETLQLASTHDDRGKLERVWILCRKCLIGHKAMVRGRSA